MVLKSGSEKARLLVEPVLRCTDSADESPDDKFFVLGVGAAAGAAEILVLDVSHRDIVWRTPG